MSTENRAVGPGVYILTAIWSVSLLLCVVSVRTGRSIGAIAIISAITITLSSLSIPRVHSSDDTLEPEEIYDRSFIPRYSLLALTVVCILAGSGYLFANHCLSPVRTKKLQHWAR